ncbi:hypothetical protein [Paraliobacillus sp. X-1268]|uniref:hypothetical protein n=1 Tax=Paraliobacillus sp. X-1268 TaxID=2213193 RepID=UPI0013001F62|nr:hypothetical protein [Paraliobacillus sp. X-1268]
MENQLYFFILDYKLVLKNKRGYFKDVYKVILPDLRGYGESITDDLTNFFEDSAHI